MYEMDDCEEHVHRWVTDCMPHRSVQLTAAQNLRNGVEREVWDCSLRTDAGELDAVLTVFKPGSLETVNTNLRPELVSEKCFLPMSELPALGIPTPVVLGRAVADGEAAVLCKRLVHGDYFSKNILPVAGGLCIIDWETFGWGDPMWDLGFLVGADQNLTDEEVEAVIAEYGSSATIDGHGLMWHKHRWSDFWKEREHQSSVKTDAGAALPPA